MALELLNGDLSYRSLTAALRQSADEATRNEREALAEYFEQFGKWYSGPEIAAAIRARITPKGQDDGR